MNKKELIWGLVLTALVAVLVIVGWLPLANAIGLLGVACLAWFFRKEELNRWIKVGLFLLLVPLAFWVASYEPEGFAYPLLFSLADDAGEAARYQLSVDFAKGIAGFLLLYLLWPRLRANEFVVSARLSLVFMLLAPLFIIGVAISVLGLQWQPKPVEQILQFAVVSLLITCIAEEVFMRFLFQQNLRNAIASFTANRALQDIIPLLLVTGIFVAIHAGISGAAIWVYALVGFLYGLSYTLSKNILYPIAIHFLVNQIHFSFLTYPL
ncbi:CPBP family intramembrane glutamic endopeptidase [Cellvibrio fibrivorans]|uniref:Membrane protease YdiL (CAAX protease family) n=1 Tax=Cellvibrio fibrivorans TaxID=126350 RepID=A0ABU1V1Q5_9GAMM|nr:CPBP family intramembrane glutamic endopeptidase [Cellvibrio fibrivorans]MDR7091354.1 membrane protease YdiL (CAAX protease family) [Cellvibrio fibrivorans]